MLKSETQFKYHKIWGVHSTLFYGFISFYQMDIFLLLNTKQKYIPKKDWEVLSWAPWSQHCGILATNHYVTDTEKKKSKNITKTEVHHLKLNELQDDDCRKGHLHIVAILYPFTWSVHTVIVQLFAEFPSYSLPCLAVKAWAWLCAGKGQENHSPLSPI